jgi:hypothetical protein
MLKSKESEMTGRRAIIGLSLICALAFAAFGAANASALGTTQFTCKPGVSGAGFKEEHCKEGVPSEPAFVHEGIAENVDTAILGTNLNTDGTRKSVTWLSAAAGVGVEVTCEIAKTTGTARNIKVGGVMQVHGTGIIVHYEKCKVLKPSKGECVIPGEAITTEKITSTTYENVAPDEGVEFKPEGATPLFKIKFEKCKNAALNTTFPVEGSFKASASGTTQDVTPATSEKTLTFGGEPMKLTQTLTKKMEEAGGTEGNGVSLTTVP